MTHPTSEKTYRLRPLTTEISYEAVETRVDATRRGSRPPDRSPIRVVEPAGGTKHPVLEERSAIQQDSSAHLARHRR
ncbi:hypothetical protein BHE74_00004737 [Ensete ventricosum]|nr:hypothetical protein BHE74_00004737 [Ensete ventricosum]